MRGPATVCDVVLLATCPIIGRVSFDTPHSGRVIFDTCVMLDTLCIIRATTNKLYLLLYVYLTHRFCTYRFCTYSYCSVSPCTRTTCDIGIVFAIASRMPALGLVFALT